MNGFPARPISALPVVDDAESEVFELVGQATIYDAVVKLVIKTVCLEFRCQDVLRIDVPEGRELAADRLVPVVAQIRRGATVLSAYPSDVFVELTDRVDRPFAVAVRSGFMRRPSDGLFAELERGFLQRTGLAVPPS
jgi:hypothetical protein